MAGDEVGQVDRLACMIVVPCYNEAERFPRDRYAEFLRRGSQVRMLFVNDGSTDGTLALLQGLRAEFPARVAVLDKQPNGGKAEAVRVGMLAAVAEGGLEFTGFWDADLATPLEEIPELLRDFERTPRLEMVFGSRVRLLGRAIHRRPMRHYLGRCFATCASLMLGLPIYDTQCGAKLFRVTEQLREVLAEPFGSRWIFDVEIVARFLARHRRDREHVSEIIYESPLRSWTDVAGSKVKPTDFFRAFAELLEIRQRYLR